VIKLVSVKTMRESDAQTIKNGTSGKELMHRAAEGIFRAVSWLPPVAVVCGTGNNGGDGYAVAELLTDAGIPCVVFLWEERFSEDGKYYYDCCVQKDVEMRLCKKDINFMGFGTVLDCLFGTGFRGEARGLAKIIIEKINASAAYVVSADINSGLNGDSGIGGACVCSNLTVSIGSYKPGHFLNMAKDLIQELTNIDIGIGISGEAYQLIEEADISDLFVRKHFANKGDYGYVALIGGSPEYSGAAKLANLACAAMRSGAGVVRLAVPVSIAFTVMPYLLESTLFSLRDDGEGHIVFNRAQTERLLAHTKAAAMGMGIGRSEETDKLLSYLLAEYTGTLIIDADGLNALAEHCLDLLPKATCKVILTPHLKEFSRLCGLSVSEILLDPVQSAKDFAKAYGVTLLLKGPATIVTDGETVILVDRGCPGMATAGSGDVLSGILAGIAGFCEDTARAATAAAYINGLAGELAEAQTGSAPMLAGDTCRHIAEAVKRIAN